MKNIFLTDDFVLIVVIQRGIQNFFRLLYQHGCIHTVFLQNLHKSNT